MSQSARVVASYASLFLWLHFIYYNTVPYLKHKLYSDRVLEDARSDRSFSARFYMWTTYYAPLWQHLLPPLCLERVHENLFLFVFLVSGDRRSVSKGGRVRRERR